MEKKARIGFNFDTVVSRVEVPINSRTRPKPPGLSSACGLSNSVANWIVTRGVRAGERVVVEGFMTLRAGMSVHPLAYVPPKQQVG